MNAEKYFAEKLEFTLGPYDVHRLIDSNDKEHAIVDVRDPDSYRKGRVPGAINVPADEVEKHLELLPKSKTLILYCYNDGCFAAPKAALLLARKGYKVKEMVGGFEDYESHQHPVERG
jgi:rhodanese-related sulfurtransferase